MLWSREWIPRWCRLASGVEELSAGSTGRTEELGGRIHATYLSDAREIIESVKYACKDGVTEYCLLRLVCYPIWTRTVN